MGREHCAKAQTPDGGYAMTRLLAFLFSATLFAAILAHDASARRGGGFHAGGGGLRNFSGGVYRGGLRRNVNGYRAANWGGRRYWRGRSYGYGAGIAALAGAYAYSDPYYSYYSSPSYGYSGIGSYGYSSAAVDEAEAAGAGMCGTYRYWKDGRCVDARK